MCCDEGLCYAINVLLSLCNCLVLSGVDYRAVAMHVFSVSVGCIRYVIASFKVTDEPNTCMATALN
jgi:hypothetical protein